MTEEQPKKKGLWGLFRSKSSAISAKLDHLRRASENDVVANRRRSEVPSEIPTERRRPRRPDPNAAKGKGRELINGRSYDYGPLTEWPPSGMSSSEELTLGHAMRLISRGVPAFRGHKRPVPHASDHYYALFATAAGNKGEETDAANLHDSMTQLMTMRILGSGPATYPWETLEQPSCSFGVGRRPGTVTLNYWVSQASVLPPSIPLRDPGVAPREIELERIFERLKELERGLEDDDESLMYKNLYRRLLRDPDKYASPHKTLDKQIMDLIMVLSGSDWIDFSNPRNQVVCRFIFDDSPANLPTYKKFFHQLLLSLELELRIHSKYHITEAKEKLLLQIPPSIQWSLALARRWRGNIRIEEYGNNPDEVRFRYKLKKRQVRMVKRFAQMMKWPNLAETLAALKQREADQTLDLVSSHTMAFFSGLVLPGPTFPFLMMNSLIDIDPDKATDELALLTHMHPHCGFQYRGSYTYWTAASIVGKVLAPTCHSVAGWVGPARPTVDLGRSQIALVRSRKPPASGSSGQQRVMTPEDVRTMSERSDPLGPPAEVFPVKEYALVGPEADVNDDYLNQDLVRIEMLTLRPSLDRMSSLTVNSAGGAHAAASKGPRWFDASLHFAIDGASHPFRLAFDVNFVNAWPCSDGPHPLFFDFVYESVRADELINVRDWNGQYGDHSHDLNARSLSPGKANGRAPGSSGANGNGTGKHRKHGSLSFADEVERGNGQQGEEEKDEEKVLVVEAFGVPDNEVLARAWCSQWGLSAVVADVSRTCMACAIREAYAATLTVVILVDDSEQDVDKDE